MEKKKSKMPFTYSPLKACEGLTVKPPTCRPICAGARSTYLMLGPSHLMLFFCLFVFCCCSALRSLPVFAEVKGYIWSPGPHQCSCAWPTPHQSKQSQTSGSSCKDPPQLGLPVKSQEIWRAVHHLATLPDCTSGAQQKHSPGWCHSHPHSQGCTQTVSSFQPPPTPCQPPRPS